MQNNHHIQHIQHEYDVMHEFCRLLEMGDSDAAKKLVTKNNIGFRDRFGRGFVENFCIFGPDNVELLHHFVELGATTSPNTKGGWSPLHSAACHDKHKLARGLINLGVLVDVCNSQSSTPLTFTFGYLNKKRKTVKVLLDAGAKLSLVKPHVAETTTAWARDFVSFREKVRQSCVVVLGLLKCNSRVLNAKGSGSESGRNLNVNGVDILRIISRCTWGSRGIDFEVDFEVE